MSAVWDFGSMLSGQVAMFVVSIFVARLLTPADYGVTAAARFFITLANRLTQLGLNASLVRMKETRDEHASSVFVTNLVVGILTFLVLWTASPVLGRFFDSPDVARILPVSATVFLITPFGSVASAMQRRQLQYRSLSVLGWFDLVGGMLFTLLLAWFGMGYWSIVAGALLGTVISTVGRMWLSPWRMSFRFSMSALRDTLPFGLGFQAKQLLIFSTTNLDNVVVGRVLGVVNLGFYDKAYGLMQGVTTRMAFDAALMRIYAIIRDEPARFRRALMKGVQATSLVTFPLLLFSAVTADRLVVALYGPQWAPAVGPFQVLAIVGMIRGANRPVGAACESLGLVWVQVALQTLNLLLLIVGIVIGATWGLTPASIGVLVAASAHGILSMRLLSRHTTVSMLDIWWSFWPSLATALTMGLALVMVNGALRHLGVTSPWVLLAGDVVTAAVVYPALILWTPFRGVAMVVRESVDDVVPWLRRYVRCGVLRSAPEASTPVASAATNSLELP